MSVTGEFELLANVDKLTKGYDRKARQAVKSGAEKFKTVLQNNTPVSSEDHSGKGPLRDHVTLGKFSGVGGDYTQEVGYDSSKGYIAHFPNSGTSKQRPQHFIEKSQSESKGQVLAEFVKELKVE
ncbi:HK97-gp10 family putative phage morphogenesis protein [Ligilactobacillus equi]|uniref:Uncharacterized protein n=1 Tax=Ligilactobacillus equi DSM 15833 = JCM 10991 TaxID=1423740 RepID=A0A0R1TC72_9LACO|nr:HK97-gp10 family putative phage morphogenesis protein [Ligilactobacillus equi]KRL76618.1 hypothetical protein FC36_GL001856 [Ligilactobacillus equi DSM 15833 = JCM 10991]